MTNYFLITSDDAILFCNFRYDQEYMAAVGTLMLLRLSTLCMLSISTSLCTHAADIVLPKSVIVDLIDQHCAFPKPDPKASLSLEYECADKDDDVDDADQSMNYELRLLPLVAQDFNQDGIKDVALEVESSGPMGGSATTNSAIHYLILDKNSRITDDHELLLYAPFSENIVEYEVKGNRIHYIAAPNYRSHPEAYDNDELIEPTIAFDINWVKGIPISTYFRDNCQLSKEPDKRLFTKVRGVKRNATIDIHNYTKVVKEELQINNMQVSAELNGCDAKNVTFFIEPSAGNNLPVLADILKSLIPITSQHEPLRELLKLDQQSKIAFGEVVNLSNNWSAQVHIERDFDNASVIINLS
ncbi:hypothetical protein AAJP47_00940 [Psychrobacter sp. B38]|uniref:hypothetical protein n=1 Tax=Psychrobacter sp. B38 TaxID=3143538 RepID=UPI0032111948